ncbi:MAG: hypothetical protein GYB64_12730, partial [Chloroflexi bacterium]|nr:hypothetical protein [Chloroflexota bacterium]
MKRVIGMVSIVLIAAACSWTYAVPTAAPSPAPLPTATAAAPAYDPVADEDPPLRIGSLREQLASEYAVVRVPAAEGLPEHHAVVLDGWTEPVLHLFAVDALRAAQPTADGLIEALRGDLETVEDVPVPDFMPPYSAGLLTAGRLATYNNGIGYVVQIVEPNAPANVHMLLYTFVGLTPDGRYLLVGTFPLEHPVYGQVPASREELTDTNSGDFTPSIAPLLAFYNTVTVPGATAESSTATCTFNPMIWSALDGLTWEQVEGGRLLLGLPLPVLDILPTPAGEDRILAVMQLNEPRESGVPATLAALDPDGSAHQWLNNLYDHSQDAEVVGWLPDGDMVWLDEEGAVRREGADMEAPVRMRSVWAMAAGTVIAVPANWDDPEVYRWSPESGWAAIESPDERSLVGSQICLLYTS